MSAVTAAHRQAVLDLAKDIKPAIVVEVGVYGGRLSHMLATIPTLKKLFLVDSWEGATEERQPPFFLPWNLDVMSLCAESVKAWASENPKIEVMHMRSVEAAAGFQDRSIDFVYLDADHTAAGVTADIEAWLPKIFTGGILSGDDYGMPSVKDAVNRLLPNHLLKSNGRLWWFDVERT